MGNKQRRILSANVASITPFPIAEQASVALQLSFAESDGLADRGSMRLELHIRHRPEDAVWNQDLDTLDDLIRAEARHLLSLASHRMRKRIL